MLLVKFSGKLRHLTPSFRHADERITCLRRIGDRSLWPSGGFYGIFRLYGAFQELFGSKVVMVLKVVESLFVKEILLIEK